MMNNSGRGPPLLWLLIGVVCAVGVMLAIYSDTWGIYNGLMNANHKTIAPNYINAYDNLTSDKPALTGLSIDITKPTNIWSVFTNSGQLLSGLVNTLSLGMNVINFLLNIPTYIEHALTVISTVLPLDLTTFPLFWVAITVLSIYIGVKVVQALRGTVVEP